MKAHMKISYQAVLKIGAILICLFLIYKFGPLGKSANAASSALTGKCALISTHNFVGLESYCAANSGKCNDSMSSLALLDFDAGKYQLSATVIFNTSQSTASTTQFIKSGSFTNTPDKPFPGYHQLTLDTGEIHHCVLVNSANSLLCVTSVSGESLTNDGQAPSTIVHTPSQSAVCQKL